MKRYVLSILVRNHAGVLSRVSGLFSRRGYNIDSLSVGETENPKFSRITIVVWGDKLILEQIRKQVGKLVDVEEIIVLVPEDAVYRELALIKVSATELNRAEIIGIVGIFRANIIDVSTGSITVEITGDQSKISAFMELMQPFGIVEVARTGLTGLGRGSKSIKDIEVKAVEN